MSRIVDDLANSRTTYVTGSSGTVTVPAGARVIAASAASSAGGSVTISPGGPGQVAPVAAGGAITIPASSAWTLPEMMCLGQLAGGTVFVFATTTVYEVWYAKRMG